MASRLVNHISYKVKKLIVGHAGSKPTAAACDEKEADYGSGLKNHSAAGSKPTAAACDEKEANFESGSKKHSADAAEMHRSFQDAVTKDAGADASTVMVVIKKEPMDCDEVTLGAEMEKAIGSSGELIDADDMSSVAEDVLLKYPFVGADNIEKAAVGLPLCITDDGDLSTSELVSLQLEKSVGKNSVQIITQDDHDKLKPRAYVNDVIINFWMLWLSRNCRQQDSPEHFFISHFYTKLTEEGGGVEHVSNWLARRFNIFDKCIIYFPINLDLHWSLCVAYSPSLVRDTPTNCRSSSTGGVPCILHLDSLQLHNSSVIAENIRQFLTYEWQRRFPSDNFKFTKTNYPVICPKGEFVATCNINIIYLFYANKPFLFFVSAKPIERL